MMEQPNTNPPSQSLQFCKSCGLKRICDVANKLQKLFTDRCVVANMCCICNKEVTNDDKITAESLLRVIKKEHVAAVPLNEQNWATDQKAGHGVDDDNENFAFADDEDDNTNENDTFPHNDNPDNVGDSGTANGTSESSGKRPEVVLQRLKMESVLTDGTKEIITVKKRGPGQYKRKKPKNRKRRRVQDEKPAEKLNQAPKKPRKKKMMDDRMQIDLSLLNSPGFLRERSTRLKTGAIQETKYASMVEDQKLTSSEDEEIARAKEKAKIQDDIDPDIKELMEMSEESESEVSEEEKMPRFGTEYLDPEIVEHMSPSSLKDHSKYECKHCGVKITHMSAFMKHIATHTGKTVLVKPFKCDHCNESFNYRAFCSHKKTHRNYIFKCTYRSCKYIFRSKASLRQHISVHKGYRPYFCKQCGIGFYNEEEKLAHATEHVNESHKCNECCLVFSDLVELKQHHRQAHEIIKKLDKQIIYRCKECHTCVVTKKIYLQRHMQEKHGAKAKVAQHKCIKCNALFPSRAMLTAHLEHEFCEPDVKVDIKESIKYVDPRLIAMIGRPRSSERPFRCKHCVLKEFSSAHMFMKHLQKRHAKLATDCPVTHAYICDQCNKKFKARDKLSNHILTHTDYRPFACSIENCDKKFKTSAHLDLHIKYHDKKPLTPEDYKFICTKCGKRKASLAKLVQHDNSVHLKLRPAICYKCGKGFSNKAKLTAHIRRVHENLRPWVCEVCGKAYKEKNELTHHTYTHTGEKPYSCDRCEYRCTRADYLVKHVRIHTGEKPYVCDVCNEAFSNRTSLTLHMRKHKSVKTELPDDAISSAMHVAGVMPDRPAVRVTSAIHASGVIPTTSADHGEGSASRVASSAHDAFVNIPIHIAGASGPPVGHVSAVGNVDTSSHHVSPATHNVPATSESTIAVEFLETALGRQFSHGPTYTHM